MLRFLTAGESHGQGLVAVLEGMPAGLPLDLDAITNQLRRRQGGYGRGRRMAIESDRAEILSGVRRGRTTGAPIALLIPQQGLGELAEDDARRGRDARGRDRRQSRAGHAAAARPRRSRRRAQVRPRRHSRRARARQRARDRRARRARGDCAPAAAAVRHRDRRATSRASARVGVDEALAVTFERIRAIPDESPLRCVDAAVEQQMIAAIDAAKEAGDTLGGSFEVVVARRAGRARQLRPVGSQARRPARAGA